MLRLTRKGFKFKVKRFKVWASDLKPLTRNLKLSFGERADAVGRLFEVGVAGRELRAALVGGEGFGVLLGDFERVAQLAVDVHVVGRLRGGALQRGDGAGDVL